MMKHYPLADAIRPEEKDQLGVYGPGGRFRFRKLGYWIEVRAIKTGEERCPRKDEWFLSGGGQTTAYRASRDADTSFPILRLVAVRRVEHWEEV